LRDAQGRNPVELGSWQTGVGTLINFACLFISGAIHLAFELRIFESNHGRNHYAGSHLRFAVVDLDKSESYPENFISMLPMRLNSNGKIPTVFTKLFGNKSSKIARDLLTESLKKERASEIKAEIGRRLNLLEPNPVIHIKCRVCKRFYETRKEKASKQKICPECRKRFHRKN
jgi:hypothetical protein